MGIGLCFYRRPGRPRQAVISILGPGHKLPQAPAEEFRHADQNGPDYRHLRMPRRIR